MKHTVIKTITQRMIAQRNGYLVLASGLLLLCGLLSVVVMFSVNNTRVVVVPPNIKKSFWLTEHQVSSEYLLEMSSFFVNTRLNITPSNIDHNRELLLQHTDASFYGALKAKLVDEAKRIQKHHISSVFYPSQFKLNLSRLSVLVTGEIKTWVGETALQSRHAAYQLQYKYQGGRLLITQFKEVNRDA